MVRRVFLKKRLDDANPDNDHSPLFIILFSCCCLLPALFIAGCYVAFTTPPAPTPIPTPRPNATATATPTATRVPTASPTIRPNVTATMTPYVPSPTRRPTATPTAMTPTPTLGPPSPTMAPGTMEFLDCFENGQFNASYWGVNETRGVALLQDDCFHDWQFDPNDGGYAAVFLNETSRSLRTRPFSYTVGEILFVGFALRHDCVAREYIDEFQVRAVCDVGTTINGTYHPNEIAIIISSFNASSYDAFQWVELQIPPVIMQFGVDFAIEFIQRTSESGRWAIDCVSFARGGRVQLPFPTPTPTPTPTPRPPFLDCFELGTTNPEFWAAKGDGVEFSDLCGTLEEGGHYAAVFGGNATAERYLRSVAIPVTGISSLNVGFGVRHGRSTDPGNCTSIPDEAERLSLEVSVYGSLFTNALIMNITTGHYEWIEYTLPSAWLSIAQSQGGVVYFQWKQHSWSSAGDAQWAIDCVRVVADSAASIPVITPSPTMSPTSSPTPSASSSPTISPTPWPTPEITPSPTPTATPVPMFSFTVPACPYLEEPIESCLQDEACYLVSNASTGYFARVDEVFYDATVRGNDTRALLCFFQQEAFLYSVLLQHDDYQRYQMDAFYRTAMTNDTVNCEIGFASRELGDLSTNQGYIANSFGTYSYFTSILGHSAMNVSSTGSVVAEIEFTDNPEFDAEITGQIIGRCLSGPPLPPTPTAAPYVPAPLVFDPTACELDHVYSGLTSPYLHADRCYAVTGGIWAQGQYYDFSVQTISYSFWSNGSMVNDSTTTGVIACFEDTLLNFRGLAVANGTEIVWSLDVNYDLNQTTNSTEAVTVTAMNPLGRFMSQYQSIFFVYPDASVHLIFDGAGAWTIEGNFTDGSEWRANLTRVCRPVTAEPEESRATFVPPVCNASSVLINVTEAESLWSGQCYELLNGVGNEVYELESWAFRMQAAYEGVPYEDAMYDYQILDTSGYGAIICFRNDSILLGGVFLTHNRDFTETMAAELYMIYSLQNATNETFVVSETNNTRWHLILPSRNVTKDSGTSTTVIGETYHIVSELNVDRDALVIEPSDDEYVVRGYFDNAENPKTDYDRRWSANIQRKCTVSEAAMG